MGIILTRYILSLDKIYLIGNGTKSREVQLVHTTQRGFNFVDAQTGKLVLKKHIYPREQHREGKEFTFLFPRSIIINKKINKNGKTKIEDAS